MPHYFRHMPLSDITIPITLMSPLRCHAARCRHAIYWLLSDWFLLLIFLLRYIAMPFYCRLILRRWWLIFIIDYLLILISLFFIITPHFDADSHTPAPMRCRQDIDWDIACHWCCHYFEMMIDAASFISLHCIISDMPLAALLSVMILPHFWWYADIFW